MENYYEDIVCELYSNLRPKFIRILTAKYPSIRLDEAEDLYQDTFIAVKDNMERGRFVITPHGRHTLFKLE